MEIDGFAQATRRHRVGKARARFVIANPVVVLTLPAPSAGRDERTVYLGDDHTGRPLEVITVPSSKGGLYVIHVMGLTTRFRPYYERTMQEE